MFAKIIYKILIVKRNLFILRYFFSIPKLIAPITTNKGKIVMSTMNYDDGTSTEKGEKSTTSDSRNDDNYNSKLQRIQLVFEATTTAQLADKMKITPQAVTAAIRQKIIPKPWIKKAIQRGATIEYINKGDGHYIPQSEEQVQPIEGQVETHQPQATESKPDQVISHADHKDEKALRNEAVRSILEYTLTKKRLEASENIVKVLTVVIKMNILPTVLDNIEEWYRGFKDPEDI
jgi:hypothetical protein